MSAGLGLTEEQIHAARSRDVVIRSLLERNAAQAPDEVFVTFEDGTRWTRREGLEIAGAAAGALRTAGIGHGDRVAVFLPNGPDFLGAWWGAALLGAAERLSSRMRSLAAAALKVEPGQVEFDGLGYTTADGAQSISWAQVAHRGWMGWGRGPTDPIALEEIGEYDPASITYGYATHAAQVAVDLDTGKVTVEAYWLVHDAGVLVNPLLVEGQIVGGVAMGFGSALLEEVVYSDTGQPLTTTYLDYILPASEDIPDIEMDHMVHPSAITPGGFKGAGESGTIPTPGAIANAVAAAVPEIAEDLVFLPMSPTRVWTLLDKAGLTR